jgi:DNA-binding XRE family transcriptional regulator
MTVQLTEIKNRAIFALTLPSLEARRSIRVAARVTIPEMASLVGVSRQTIYFWESGKRKPSGERLTKYAEALRTCRGID